MNPDNTIFDPSSIYHHFIPSDEIDRMIADYLARRIGRLTTVQIREFDEIFEESERSRYESHIQ